MSPDRCIGFTGFETSGLAGLELVQGMAAASLLPKPEVVKPVLAPILRSRDDETPDDDVEEGCGEEEGRSEEVLLTIGLTCNTALPEALLEDETVGEEAGGVEEAAAGVEGVEEAGVLRTRCEILLTLEEGEEEEVQKPLDDWGAEEEEEGWAEEGWAEDDEALDEDAAACIIGASACLIILYWSICFRLSAQSCTILCTSAFIPLNAEISASLSSVFSLDCNCIILADMICTHFV